MSDETSASPTDRRLSSEVIHSEGDTSLSELADSVRRALADIRQDGGPVPPHKETRFMPGFSIEMDNVDFTFRASHVRIHSGGGGYTAGGDEPRCGPGCCDGAHSTHHGDPPCAPPCCDRYEPRLANLPFSQRAHEIIQSLARKFGVPLDQFVDSLLAGVLEQAAQEWARRAAQADFAGASPAANEATASDIGLTERHTPTDPPSDNLTR